MTGLPQRIAAKITEQNGCWLWQGHRDRKGYARIWMNGRHQSAHRVTYELLVGEIPEGLEIDHLCRVTSCVNPGHLEHDRRRRARRALVAGTT